jgi:hypothetical protein
VSGIAAVVKSIQDFYVFCDRDSICSEILSSNITPRGGENCCSEICSISLCVEDDIFREIPFKIIPASTEDDRRNEIRSRF